MTLVNGTVQDLGYDGMEGTLWARPARFRSDGQVVLAPERKPFKITGGVVSAELAPGPAVLELQVGSHARGTFEVVIPEEDTTLAALLDTVFPWEPAQVSLFVAERKAAEQAKADAEAAASDAQTAKSDAEGAASDAEGHRTHVDAIRQTLDEAAQNNVAPYLTQTALNATYGTKAEVQAKINATVADGRYMLKGEVAPGMEVVVHDDDPTSPRPDTPASVIWAGSVEPHGMVDGDLLYLYDPIPGSSYFFDFTDDALGSVPEGWSPQWEPGLWEVRAAPSATGGRALFNSETVNMKRRALAVDAVSSDPDADELEIVVKWKSNHGSQTVRVVSHGGGAASQENGYWVFNNTSDGRIGRYSDGTSTFPFISSGPAGTPAQAGVWNVTRLRVADGRIQYRTWPHASTEPSEWLIDVTDPAPLPAGWAGVLAFNDGDKWIDWVGIGTGGRPAQMGA